jgi:hypothetical protein
MKLISRGGAGQQNVYLKELEAESSWGNSWTQLASIQKDYNSVISSAATVTLCGLKCLFWLIVQSNGQT